MRGGQGGGEDDLLANLHAEIPTDRAGHGVPWVSGPYEGPRSTHDIQPLPHLQGLTVSKIRAPKALPSPFREVIGNLP